ncbi:guanine nucleotide-binding protein subunit gamma [Cryptococcus deuterogattii R265]|uniref:guanine nucleotide-binding protein subunit gamma n=1 Tax=Cryptococcus deuterogattii (strain R265) TaxID=294750 RepID=UPI0019381FC7|nr:guanine nucleotide-binding protein subunit gamma [Cryptococcus deuterogattii R265]
MSHLAPASIVRPHKTSMAELKLRRLNEHNARLREDLARPRARVSEASISLIKYCSSTKDPLLPSVWGPPGKKILMLLQIPGAAPSCSPA